EMIPFDQSIRCGGMSLGETGHSESETAALRMRAGLVESANEFDQIDRVLERVPRFIVSNSSGPITAEREDISNGRLGVSKENLFDLLFVVADASQVRDRVQLGGVLNALDKIVSQITRCAPDAISHADEVRQVRLEITH